MAIIEEIPAPAPALARPTPADQRSGLRGVGVAIAEAAAGMGPSEPSRVAAAQALAEALLSKEQGNTAFGAGEYVEALEYYSDAIDAVTDGAPRHASVIKFAVSISHTRDSSDLIADPATASCRTRPERLSRALS